jgi:hypothetical protein
VAEVQQIIAQYGPLPIQVTADIETDGPTVVTVAGSVWTTTYGTMIGVTLLIDGNPVAKAPIFSNGQNTHRAVIPVSFPYTFTSSGKVNQHTFTLEEMTPETTSDSNDYFSVSVLY